jgi:hypothetical protein
LIRLITNPGESYITIREKFGHFDSWHGFITNTL